MELDRILRQEFLVGVLIILAVGVFAANAMTPGAKHSQGQVLVIIDGYTMNLQEAIDGYYLINGTDSPTSSGTSSINLGHNPSEIWVSVNGDEMRLTDAIASDNLCGNMTTTSYNNTCPNPGHYATEIEVTIKGTNKTLQEAIDDGDFCLTYSYTNWSEWGTCSKINCYFGVQTRTRACKRDYDEEEVDCSYCGSVCSQRQECYREWCS